MKKLYTILITTLLASAAIAQAPNKMSYQAVVRDAGNTLVINQSVGMQISILKNSISGQAVYVETQTPVSNDNGLVSLEIGSGTVISGSFNAIDWSKGSYFIKTEIDPIGGANYTISGTSQLMNVPYALHAHTADSLIGGVNGQLIVAVPSTSLVAVRLSYSLNNDAPIASNVWPGNSVTISGLQAARLEIACMRYSNTSNGSGTLNWTGIGMVNGWIIGQVTYE